jgi:hypothetical protein
MHRSGRGQVEEAGRRIARRQPSFLTYLQDGLSVHAAADRPSDTADSRGRIFCMTALPIFVIATSRSYWDCRFCHTWALVPKYRASRNAISAVTPRRRATI